MKKYLFLFVLFASCKQPTTIDAPQNVIDEKVVINSDSTVQEEDSIFCVVDFDRETIGTTTDPEPAIAIARAAESLQYQEVTYNGAYYNIKYPNGDVPSNIGVCTDVVIRTYRKLGIDLQQKVHEDILSASSAYNGVKKPDTNIDHRRVPNLMKFFERHGEVKPCSTNIEDYFPGDIVCWKLYGGLNHIGVVTNIKAPDGTYLMMHNIGSGQEINNFLFASKIIGHYAYAPKEIYSHLNN